MKSSKVDRSFNPISFMPISMEALKKMFEKEKLYKRLYDVCLEYKDTSIGLSDDSEFLNVLRELGDFK
jgi:hypothetical protein